MTVSIIIPNYNGSQLLSQNLASIITAARGSEIILVDDGSTDDSVLYIKKHFPQLKLIEKATNSGFATTVNLGVKAASGDIVVLLNTDIIPQDGFLENLLPHFQNKDTFAVGCLDESLEGDQIIKRGRGIGSFKQGLFVHRRGGVNLTNTLWVSGGSSAFRKKYWEKIGGLDEMYNPFYWEDLDISYRAQKIGWKIYFEPKSRVRHLHEKGSIKSHYSDSAVTKIAYRNQFLFIWKNITDSSLIIEHLFWLPYHLSRALISGNFNLLSGFFSALCKLKAILQKRRQQKRWNTRTDANILAQFTQ